MTHTVTLISRESGEEHHIEVAGGETVLEAALRHGLHIPYGCRNGSCGSCRAHILSGRVAYPREWPPALTREQAEQGDVMLCRALPERDLVVEPRRIMTTAEGFRPRRRPARVARLERLCHDVMGLYLKLPPSDRLQFRAGQYLDILLRDGRRRSFSMANAPHEDALVELHVRRVEDGRYTNEIFTRMKPKAMLRIEAPLGDFFLREDSDRPIIMMGGGTGFAPLKSMLTDMLHREVERPVHLYWGVRALRDLYMADWIETQLGRQQSLRFTPVLSEPDPGDAWAGRTGLVHRAVLDDYDDLSGHEVYMSGPPPMIDAARPAFAARGLPEEHLFYDSFEWARD
ncbi:MAG TPA: CDP-6-deoxy-delta-3,4-glucoseen reductase [Gammaproteobacteria bacterium]|nr:CDP-6-deoxy-delta-3,4-glucoseen reductase [Gammaproteobacteria bacterium]